MDDSDIFPWIRDSEGAAEQGLDRRVSNSRAVSIIGNAVVANGIAVPFYSRHPDDVLVAYLELIRRLRGNAPTSPLRLRRDDIEELSRFLNRRGTEIVNDLAVLMGTTRLRGASMVARFDAGDSVIETGMSSDSSDGLPDEAVPAESLSTLGQLHEG